MSLIFTVSLCKEEKKNNKQKKTTTLKSWNYPMLPFHYRATQRQMRQSCKHRLTPMVNLDFPISLPACLGLWEDNRIPEEDRKNKQKNHVNTGRTCSSCSEKDPWWDSRHATAKVKWNIYISGLCSVLSVIWVNPGNKPCQSYSTDVNIHCTSSTDHKNVRKKVF